MKSIPKMCRDQDMPAMALTDSNNLFGALEFSEYMSGEGIQPIIGLQLDCDFDQDPSVKFPPSSPMVFLAQSETGYLNLLKLSSHYFLSQPGQKTPVPREIILNHHEGLIALTGGAEGPVGRKISLGKIDIARDHLQKMQAVFGDRLYVEIERHGNGEAPRTEAEASSEAGLIALAYELGLPLVATNNALFPERDMYEAHDAMLCVADGTYVDQPTPRRHVTENHYFKTQREMVALFADLPEAIENTVEIAKRCAFKAYKRDPILPKFADDEVTELRRLSHEGLDARLKVIPHAASVDAYKARLDFELGVIEGMGFPGYFLIVADFIQWAKARGIPVGPGRGSGAGSLVAYALTITDLDPLRFGLLFERFLNPERVSMPDFDIDFCMDRREEVIHYVQDKYGRDRVAQIITFGALLSKAAIRDIGRVLQMPYGQVDRLSKLIPVEGVKPVSIAQARRDEPKINEEARAEEVVARMLGIAEKLEGLYRNAGTHAAGVVIGDRPLDLLVPLYQDPRSTMPATGFNMKWVEAAGLVKFDFLGLKTLTVIKNAVDLLKKRGVELDIDTIPLDDEKTFDLYASANTIAVFQVESPGMRDALRQMKPTCIEDIVALVALYRPGPMENIPKFCKVKNGLEDRELIHPSIDSILDETQGIIVYQEQVMEIAQKMAGYTLGGADLLRRAMGKKIAEEMAKERPKFVDGSKAQGVDEKLASEVFDLLEKFANYGFNKSHAAAYALVSYQTAYLKANYPVEFMAAVMNGDLHLTDKLAVFKQELDNMAIPCVPCCVNRSSARFDVKDGAVLYALGALKGVGPEAMELIVAARKDGVFKDLIDFARRVDLRRVGKRPLEMLARAGGFDEIELNRSTALANVESLMKFSGTAHDAANSNQHSLFGDSGDDLPPPRLIRAEELLPTEKLTEEQKAVGFYLSGHPMDSYRKILKRHQIKPLSEVSVRAETEAFSARIAGTVSACQERISARGKKFAFVQISDPSGIFEVMVFSEQLEKYRELFKTGTNIVMGIEVARMGDNLRTNLKSAQPIDQLDYDQSRPVLELTLIGEDAIDNLASMLKRLEGEKGKLGELRVVLPIGEGATATMKLAKDIPLGAEAQMALSQCAGVIEAEAL